MPRRITRKFPAHIKRKYYEKILSTDGIYTTWHRNLQAAPIFAEWAWLQISVFDLSELGLGLLYNILPIEFEPYAIDFRVELPKPEETLQGIWMKFERFRFEDVYAWMTDFKYYVLENLKEKFQASVLNVSAKKAKYGFTMYAMGLYDPIVAREFLRGTLHRLRLLRTPDTSWMKTMEQVIETLDMTRVTDKHIFNRLVMLFSAQTNAFVLGLSLLGKARLTEVEGNRGVIPVVDAEGNEYDVKFRTLDHLQMGFILGLTPLGYGLLMPDESIYALKDGNKNPSIIQVLVDKILGIVNRVTSTVWAYGNYNKVEEMRNYHYSDRTAQYDLLQTQRRMIESWVEARIPPEESNPVRIRQYQNAVLQLVCWKAKRHKWGFKAWESMSDDDFKKWWLDHWSTQGLNRQVLEKLHEGAKRWISDIRQTKLRLGIKVKKERLRRALSL